MTTTAPDARQLAGETLPASPFPGRTESLRVYIDQPVHDAIYKHASENTTVEICGVLVGTWKRDEAGQPYAHVTASIRGDAAASKTAEVTFTHETWSRINASMDKDFADKVIVGWYHTHPNFGIFLSDRDVFIHQHFFSAPGQVALVIDPIRKEEGVFTWQAGKPVLAAAHWVGAGQRWAPRSTDAPIQMTASAEAAPASATAAPAPAPAPSALTFALYAAAAAGLIAVGFYVAGVRQDQQRILTVQALAQQLYNRTSSPVTQRSLVEIRTLLDEIDDHASKLTEPRKEGAEPPKLDRINASIKQRVALAKVELDRATEAESLTPEQVAALDLILSQRLQVIVDQVVKDRVARGILTVNKPPSDDPSAGTKPVPAPADKPAPATNPAKGGK